jgi:hypothetical protein
MAASAKDGKEAPIIDFEIVALVNEAEGLRIRLLAE